MVEGPNAKTPGKSILKKGKRVDSSPEGFGFPGSAPEESYGFNGEIPGTEAKKVSFSHEAEELEVDEHYRGREDLFTQREKQDANRNERHKKGGKLPEQESQENALLASLNKKAKAAKGKKKLAKVEELKEVTEVIESLKEARSNANQNSVITELVYPEKFKEDMKQEMTNLLTMKYKDFDSEKELMDAYYKRDVGYSKFVKKFITLEAALERPEFKHLEPEFKEFKDVIKKSIDSFEDLSEAFFGVQKHQYSKFKNDWKERVSFKKETNTQHRIKDAQRRVF